jgi:hypothetical protein
MRQILLTGFAALAVAASAVVGSASAATVYGTLVAPNVDGTYTGSRTLNVNELEAGGAAGITTLNLSWNIGYNLGLWNYSYTMN